MGPGSARTWPTGVCVMYSSCAATARPVLPEAITATWPHATIQTCVMHLIRPSMRFVAYQDRKSGRRSIEADLHRPRPGRGTDGLDGVCGLDRGKKYPATVQAWETTWDRFTPFLDFAPATRKVIYTTNAIESLNYQLRKVTQEPQALPQRRRRSEAALAGDHEHRGQTIPRTHQTSRPTQGPAPYHTRQTHRRSNSDRLESRPRQARDGLPRTLQPPPVIKHSNDHRLHKQIDKLRVDRRRSSTTRHRPRCGPTRCARCHANLSGTST